MRRRLFLRVSLLLALAFFSFLMIRLTLPYAAMRPNINFLRTKERIYHIGYWRISFYTHVFTSCLVLIAGFTQFAPRLLVRKPQIHRVMGWAYLLTVTMVSGPAAFVMALYANGGLPARASFTLLSVLWITFTACAGYYAIRKRFTLHGAFMFRSYALTLSAITLRGYTYLIDLTTLPFTPRDIYITTAWLSWVPNLILAEILIRNGWVEKVYRMPQPTLQRPSVEP
ncbi:DUF2306 domain-containing protein [Puia dinghuensis]|uniref:DUF2306 domain-containing protein n=1 Tax=Puia dinghuensis TaxID=1792502 RepID=A0A8J2XU96_9BACT|nr:DUF2306 domain-containing protein [Puia dinghuensis]GGB08841.1 hypothetical protein GCM10011511_35430 [Puia dinghuensis]